MIIKDAYSITIYFFETFLKRTEISHFISTRMGGFSDPPYESLNLGFHVGDDSQNVLKNRKLLVKTIGTQLNNLTTVKQVHDGNIKKITEDLKGSGSIDLDSAIEATDAMVTDVAGIYLMVLLADCVPILFFDTSKKVVGVAHAGWRGTIKLVAQNTVRTLIEDFNSSPRDIIVGIGPSIGPCCYQVGPDVIALVNDTFQNMKDYISKETSDGKGYFDLWTANLRQITQMGIPEANIEIAEICTFHNANLFFSERQRKGKTGRFGAGIMIKDEDF